MRALLWLAQGALTVATVVAVCGGQFGPALLTLTGAMFLGLILT